jgi:hypothetical protein
MKLKNKKKKKNNNKDDMNVVSQGFEEGYEDPKETQLKEAKRRIEEAKKPFNPMDFMNTKNIIIFIIWYSLYRLFLKYNFGAVYFMITIIALIFLNLGQRKPGELSAYSVFNPNNERILGSMSNNNFGLGPNQFYDFNNNGLNGLNNQIEQMRQIEREINEEVNRKVHYDTKSELRKEYLKSKAEQSLNSNCSCGSGKKYKNCCLKKVK